MDDVALRALLVLNVVVPLVFFMSAVYLALHIVFARLIGRPGSAVLWFFSIVTSPLTRPVRAALPSGTAEGRVRVISLAVYAALWIVARVVFHQLTAVRFG